MYIYVHEGVKFSVNLSNCSIFLNSSVKVSLTHKLNGAIKLELLAACTLACMRSFLCVLGVNDFIV